MSIATSISTRIVGGLVALFVATLVVAGVGLFTSNVAFHALSDVTENRVDPMKDLKAVSDAFAVNIVDASHKVRNGGMSWEDGVKAVTEARDNVERIWRQFSREHVSSAQDRTYIAEIEREMGNAMAATRDLIAVLTRRDQRALETFIVERMYPAIDPTTEAIGKLMDHQVSEARRAFTTFEATYRWATIANFAALMVALAAFAFAIYVARASVLKPLARLTTSMSRLAAGDLAADVPGAERKDEIGAMAANVAVFKANAIARHELEAQTQAEAREKEGRRQAIESAIIEFRSAVENAIDGLATTSRTMQSTATELDATAKTASGEATSAAGASTETANNVQTVAAATEELSASVAEIARRLAGASDSMRQATAMAKDTDTQIQSLATAGEKIGAVVSLIQAIAEQTNLLALNATIEAARAGDAGRGFAVVASEVKQLAGQTAKATQEIAQQVAGIQAATGVAVSGVRRIAETMGEIDHATSAIAAAVEEQGAATRDIAGNVQMAARGTESLAESVSQVTASIAATTTAAQTVSEGTRALEQRRSAIASAVEHFLKRVAA